MSRRRLALALALAPLAGCLGPDRSLALCRAMAAGPCVQAADLVAAFRDHPDEAAARWGAAADPRFPDLPGHGAPAGREPFLVCGRHLAHGTLSGQASVDLGAADGRVTLETDAPSVAFRPWTRGASVVVRATWVSVVRDRSGEPRVTIKEGELLAPPVEPSLRPR